MLRNFLLSTPLFLLLAACGPGYSIEGEIAMDEQGWFYQDSLVATFNIEDTSAIYNLHLLLDHKTSFPFQNFYVRIHTTFPSGERLTEQVSLEIAGKAGNWLGDCNSSECSLRIPLQEGAYFNQAGDYQITVEQFSRRDPLPGLQRVAFALEETGETR